MSLPAAIEKARVIWEKEGKHPVRTAAVASHWDFSEKSSTFRGCLAALGHYGLLTQVGGPGAGEYKLTERAVKILAGEPEEKAAAIREAALSPKLFRELWNRFGGDLPSDQNLESRLVIDIGLNRDSVAGFIKDFRASIALAKLENADEASGEDEEQENSDEETLFSKWKAKVQNLPPATPTRQGGAPSPPMNPALRYLPIPLDIGDAPIPVGMSDDDFQLLLDTLQLWKKKIVKPEFPKDAIWRNADADNPVVIVGFMGTTDGRGFYRSEDGTAIPADELTFV
jgi:hypothetical protein